MVPSLERKGSKNNFSPNLIMLLLKNEGSGNSIDGNPKAGSSTSGIEVSALAINPPGKTQRINLIIMKK